MKSYQYLGKVNSHEAIAALAPAELKQLAEEIRDRVTTAVSANGGHLASNLGVTELTLALHNVFDFAQDRLIWDVGHQCYIHKMLTGRSDLFDDLRKGGGVSGFPSPSESPTDQFAVGHAGTAIPTAVGLALGAQLQSTDEKIVAVVGDASIVNGLSFEGLNNTSLIKRQLLIVLNDNSMGISKTEGALAHTLMQLRLSSEYEDLKRRTRQLVRRLPLFGRKLVEGLDHLKEGIKTTLHGSFEAFELLGMPYFGPVDGHDTQSLIKIFKTLRTVDHPVLLHVHTEKGRGFTPASEDPCRFHSPPAFKLDGQTATIEKGAGKSFTSAFADAMTDVMKQNEKVIAFTAAMPDGTGVSALQKAFPDRSFDVGIAESACVDIAAGMAKSGLRPVVSIYSTFLQRAFDQVFQEVSLQNLPVVFCLDRAGLVGGDGAVHHGFSDIATLRTLPHLILTAPLNEEELRLALDFALEQSQPCVIRYPRATVPQIDLPQPLPAFEMGKPLWLREGKNATILAYGVIAAEALSAAEMLQADGFEVAVINARFAKPFDADSLRQIFGNSSDGPLVTVEDHGLCGGFGSAVLEQAAELGLTISQIVRLGIPDRFVAQNSRSAQLAQAGIDARHIAARVRQCLLKDDSDQKEDTQNQDATWDPQLSRHLKIG